MTGAGVWRWAAWGLAGALVAAAGNGHAAGVVAGGAAAGATAVGVSGQMPAKWRDTEAGPVLTTPAGMTLYTTRFDEASPGKSRCTNARYTIQNGRQFGKVPLPAPETRKTCAFKRPPFLAAAGATASGDWTLIVRDDGARQWAYHGKPLYTSIKDHRPGEVNGEMFINNYVIWGVAQAPENFPPGFKLLAYEEGQVLAVSDGRPVYVRRSAKAAVPAVLQPIVAPGLGKVDGKWSIVERAGEKQYAFGGQPLYVLAEGYTAADVEAAGGWGTAIYRKAAPRPAEILTRTTLLGKVFTTRQGMTLYRFTCMEMEAPDYLPCDDPGDAAAYWSALCGDGKECARRWRPYRPSPKARPSGDFSIMEVTQVPFLDPTGVTQPAGVPKVKVWAYRGRPLYTFVDDDEPGQTLGDWINYFSRSSFDAALVPGPGIY